MNLSHESRLSAKIVTADHHEFDEVEEKEAAASQKLKKAKK